jgi:DNA-binding HxlR family transcriptional regulator
MTYSLSLNKKTAIMGSSKTRQYTPKQLSFARIGKSIGHPARVAIVQHLAEFGLATNIEIMEVTQLADATVAQHLNELVCSGMITETYINRHYYQLSPVAEKAVESLCLIFKGSGDVSKPVIRGAFPR